MLLVACPHCQAEMKANAINCGVCGKLLETAPHDRPSAATLSQLANNPWIVLATIFFATAAFGIPLIWISRAWSTRMKIVLTVVTILYTIFILWVFMLIMSWCYHRIRQAL